LRVIERPFGHDARYGQRHLLTDLRERQLRHSRVASPVHVEHAIRIQDGALTAFYGHVHVRSPLEPCAAARTAGCPGQGIRPPPGETVDDWRAIASRTLPAGRRR